MIFGFYFQFAHQLLVFGIACVIGAGVALAQLITEAIRSSELALTDSVVNGRQDRYVSICIQNQRGTHAKYFWSDGGCSWSGVKIRRALGPMARKIACGPSKLTLVGPAGPAGFKATLIPLQVQSPKKENIGHWCIVRALKNMTFRAQMTLDNFC